MKGLRKGVVLLITLMVINLLSAECRYPVLHRVGGGRFAWNPNNNFTNWSIHEQFYVGDWLYFGFDKRIYDVLEVNKTSYENCEDKDFLTNVTRGGRDVFNLTDAKVYYFLSGRGFCFMGMKVVVPVQEFHPQAQDNDLVFNNGFSYYNYSSFCFGQIIFVALFFTVSTCINIDLLLKY